MRRLAIILIWFIAAQVGGQERSRFSVSVEAVYLNVVVVDFVGRFHPELTADDVYEKGRLSEAGIYTVGFQGATPAGYGINQGFLKRLAEESGGRALFPKGVEELSRAFAQIQDELHSQYRLAYVPKNNRMDGSWRRIEVRIKGTTHLHARTRQGYYAIRR